MNEPACKCEHCQHKMCARRVPIFSSLDAGDIDRIVDLIHQREYDRGEIIVTEGFFQDSLLIISSGKVKAFRNTPDGREQILYIFSEGDFVGERNLLRDQEAVYSIEALEKTEVCAIRKSDFRQLLRRYSGISLKILEELCSRLDRLERTIEGMGVKNAEARVSAVLLEFSKRYGKSHPKGTLVELPLSREGIAGYIGVARETVSRKLGCLQDEGIIEPVGNKKVIIKNIDALLQETL